MITASIPEAGMIEETTTLLDQLIADVICRQDAVDRQALFAEYPHLAGDLRVFFSDRNEMQRLAEPISSDPEPPLPAPFSTVESYSCT